MGDPRVYSPSTAAVTGTNGKTTTTTMIDAIVAAAGEPSARVTTLGTWVGGRQIARQPTLEAFQLLLETAAPLGVRTLAIEASSAALAEGFAHRWPARVAVFTNLTRDHLDYHKTFEHYLASKAQLFITLPEGGAAVLNAADPASAVLHEVAPPGARRLGYAARKVDATCAELPLILAATRIEVSLAGTRITLAPSPLAERLGGELVLGVCGAVMAENALAAAVAGDALGYPADVVRRGLEGFTGVPGRFERVVAAPLVIVDYAHTPDALRWTLETARGLARQSGGRLCCVFGCGGDRDPGKRAEMGRVAGALADAVVVTTDNPRTEDPALISYMVLQGLRGSAAEVERVADRAEAIEGAIRRARPTDVVVIAGKGHEKEQILASGAIPFDDAAVARRAARSA